MRRRNERKSRPSVLVADCSCPQPRWKDSSGQQRRVKESDSTAAIRKLDASSLSAPQIKERVSMALGELDREFLSRVVAWPRANDPGYVNVHWRSLKQGGMATCSTRTVDELIAKVEQLLTLPDADIYICMSQQKEKGIRNANNAQLLKSIFLDVDVKADPKCYASIEEALKAVAGFITATGLPPCSAIICSGNGLQCHWISNVPLDPETWKSYAERLKQAALDFGLRFDERVTADRARVLRVPATFNHKTDPAKPTSILKVGEDVEFASQLSKLPVLSPKKPSASQAGPAWLDKFRGKKPPAALAHLNPHTDKLSDGIRTDIMTAEELSVCHEAIPNDKTDWNFWNNMLMRIWAASDVEDYGLEEAKIWSAKNPVDGTGESVETRWNTITSCPPTRTGPGALVEEARRCLGDRTW